MSSAVSLDSYAADFGSLNGWLEHASCQNRREHDLSIVLIDRWLSGHVYSKLSVRQSQLTEGGGDHAN